MLNPYLIFLGEVLEGHYWILACHSNSGDDFGCQRSAWPLLGIHSVYSRRWHLYSVSMETRIGASCSSSPTIFVCNMIVYILMLRSPRLFGKRFHVLFFHWIHSIPQCIYLYNFIFLNYGLCVSFLQLTYRYCLQNINPIPCCLSPWLPKPPLAQR